MDDEIRKERQAFTHIFWKTFQEMGGKLPFWDETSSKCYIFELCLRSDNDQHDSSSSGSGSGSSTNHIWTSPSQQEYTQSTESTLEQDQLFTLHFNILKHQAITKNTIIGK
ncbi:hypothetical protein FDP41_007033 [Naegleria fowleri]|nr:uncharacterized protein FDP41_007033 [Naegleria fowleri]KAF0973949.1 hypothetical protein FDP41_007033 [Naegleria fowleri]